jgi:hypothetical protein
MAHDICLFQISNKKNKLKIMKNELDTALKRYMFWAYFQHLHWDALKTKTRKKNKLRSSIGIKNILLKIWKKMLFFREKIMICTCKSNIFDTFSVLDLNPNEKKNTFSKSVGLFNYRISNLGEGNSLVSRWVIKMVLL